MKRAIIIDIDGTLANCDHRKHFMEQEPKDWESFYAGISDDTANVWCLELINLLTDAELDNPKIIFVTGRPERLRDKTEKWFEGKVWCASLFMRANDDHRKDAIVKQEIYEREIKGKYDVLFVLEDRTQCVEMWRAQGLVCLQCAPGNF